MDRSTTSPSLRSTSTGSAVLRLGAAAMLACCVSLTVTVAGRAGTATDSSKPQDLTAVDDLLYFTASDGVHGRELWVSNGTAAGTHLVEDLEPAGSSRPYDLTSMGGRLYFTAEVGGVRGLWKTDGTGDEASIVATIPGAEDWLGSLTAVGDTLYFLVGFRDEQALWKTDGSEDGTEPVEALLDGDYNDFEAVGDILFFWRRTEGTKSSLGDGHLWRSDGTPEGTRRVKTFPEAPFTILTAVGSKLFFLKQVGDTGHFPVPAALWKSNGTAVGTKLVRDLAAGDWDAAYGVTDAGGIAYLHDWHNGLWKSDGTYAGTVFLKTVAVSYSHPKTYVGGEVFFVVFRFIDDVVVTDLWRTDGTTAGTRFVSHAAPWQCLTPFEGCDIGRQAGGQAGVAGHLYFPAENGGKGVELWKSDGTTAGTGRVKDIRPGTTGSDPSNLTRAGGMLYFVANDGMHGRELWVSDGTSPGTKLVRDIR